jgi:hypothetical protein
MKYLMALRRMILNPFRVLANLGSCTSGFAGGYSNSSSSDFSYIKILKGFNLNNRGYQPTDDGRKDTSTLKGLNFQNQTEKVEP